MNLDALKDNLNQCISLANTCNYTLPNLTAAVYNKEVSSQFCWDE
jgi:hypothetical protein